ncbi:hypothetical protein BDZ94DRAFT_1263331, partial [Collybia nuda]
YAMTSPCVCHIEWPLPPQPGKADFHPQLNHSDSSKERVGQEGTRLCVVL